MSELENIINQAFERRADISPSSVDSDTKKAVEQAIELIDNGKERVAEQRGVGDWKVNEWLKKAVLLSSQVTRHNNLQTPVCVSCHPLLHAKDHSSQVIQY